MTDLGISPEDIIPLDRFPDKETILNSIDLLNATDDLENHSTCVLVFSYTEKDVTYNVGVHFYYLGQVLNDVYSFKAMIVATDSDLSEEVKGQYNYRERSGFIYSTKQTLTKGNYN